LAQDLGHVLHHLLGILIGLRVVLHDQEAVVVLLQDHHELENCEGAAHFQGGEVAVHPAEHAGVVAADVEDLEALQALVAVEGRPASPRGR